jgi:hypothetical protein
MGAPTRREPRFVYLSAESSVGLRFGWRLLAANNRPLGRGPHSASSLAECRAAVALLWSNLRDVASAMLPDPRRGIWTWGVDLDGTIVAVSVHPYLRRVECGRGLGQFLAAAAAADPGKAIVRHLGIYSPRELSGTGG